MADTHYYQTTVEWMGDRWGYLGSSQELPVLEVASPPEFNGREHVWTPEHLFVASVNACFMATFVAIAEMSKLDVTGFTSTAVGKLEKTAGFGYRISEVVLKPQVVLRSDRDIERASRLLVKAERNCFISNSILSQVRLEPDIKVEGAYTAA